MGKSVGARVFRSLLWTALLLLLLAGMVWRWMFYTPGASYAGTVQVTKAEPLSRELEGYVTALATDIGQRGTYDPPALRKASLHLQEQFKSFGYTPAIQTYQASGIDCDNIEVEVRGSKSPQRIVVVGAHYDTVQGTGGANDNSSGVAGVLALSRMLKDSSPAATIRFVAFVNEEPPHFQTPRMGSMVYAKACKDRGDQIIGMLSLETIGYYSDQPNSQRYPSPFDKVYPSTGNFIAFVANPDSRLLMHASIDSFRKHCQFPSEGGAVPDMAPGIGWSDHWSFWQHGYEALMITDTATFRYPHYHQRADTPEKLDYGKMAKVIEGMRQVILDVAR